jgi:hypothetical protein
MPTSVFYLGVVVSNIYFLYADFCTLPGSGGNQPLALHLDVVVTNLLLVCYICILPVSGGV